MQQLREPVLEALARLGIAYEMEEHPPMFTTDDMQAFGIGGRGQILKNLFLRDAKGKRHFLVVTASEKKADLDALREALGSTRLSFGSAERLMRCLHTTQGSVSPFAVLHDRDNAVEVVFDKALAGLARRLAAGGADSETGERGAEYCCINFPRGGFMDRLISVLEGKDT